MTDKLMQLLNDTLDRPFLNRKQRIKERVKKQSKRLAKLNERLGYTTIPDPVIEETNEEYIKRIDQLNLRVCQFPVAEILVKEDLKC